MRRFEFYNAFKWAYTAAFFSLNEDIYTWNFYYANVQEEYRDFLFAYIAGGEL